MYVVARSAGAAEAAGHERVQDYCVPSLQVLHPGADLADPARGLVPKRVGQAHAGAVRPLTLDDVQVGSAQSRPADFD